MRRVHHLSTRFLRHQRLVKNTTRLFMKGNTPPAMNLFIQPQKNVPPEYKAAISLANACYEFGNYTQALVKYDEALRVKDSPIIDALLGKGKCCHALKEYKTAIEYFKAVLSYDDYELQEPVKAAALYYRGKCYSELSLKDKGKYLDNAFEDFSDVIDMAFRNHGVAFNLMLGNKRYDDSGVNSFGRVGGGKEDDYIVPLAYVNRACVFLSFKSWDECIKDCSNAIALDGNLALAHVLRGRAFMGKNKPIYAAACFDDAIKLDPKYATAYYHRALAYAQEGYNGKALKDLTEASRLNPVNHDVYFVSGKLKLKQNRIEEALSDFNMSILLFHSFDDVNSHAYYYRGLCYQKLGDSEKAILDFSSNITLFPNFAPAYVERGEEYNKLGQYSKAIEDYTTALYINDTKQTNSPDILLKRSEAYQKRNYAQDKHRALHDIMQAYALYEKKNQVKERDKVALELNRLLIEVESTKRV